VSRRLADRTGATEEGWVYTVHLVPALSHARHYTGWTADLFARMEAHYEGDRRASRLLQVQHARGGSFILVSLERGTRDLEIARKTRGASWRCPVCRGLIRIQPEPDKVQ
jgi:hypothetical protein